MNRGSGHQPFQYYTLLGSQLFNIEQDWGFGDILIKFGTHVISAHSCVAAGRSYLKHKIMIGGIGKERIACQTTCTRLRRKRRKGAATSAGTPFHIITLGILISIQVMQYNAGAFITG